MWHTSASWRETFAAPSLNMVCVYTLKRVNPDTQTIRIVVITALHVIMQNGPSQGCPTFIYQRVTSVILGWPVVEKDGLSLGCPRLLRQKATSVTMGCFVGRVWKNNGKWCT
jgi:hypothetical protein